MRLYGLTTSERYGVSLANAKHLKVNEYNDVDCICKFNATKVFLENHGPEKNYKPYLHLEGTVKEVICKLPYDVEGILFEKDGGPRVSFDYEFSNDALVDLVGKGYYSGKLECPAIFTESIFELPCNCNFTMVTPGDDLEVPLTTVSINNRYSMPINEDTTGYSLSDYFVRVSHAAIESVKDLESTEEYEDEIVRSIVEAEKEEKRLELDKDDEAVATIDSEFAPIASEIEPEKEEEPVDEAKVEEYKSYENVANKVNAFDNNLRLSVSDYADMKDIYATTIKANLDDKEEEQPDEENEGLEEGFDEALEEDEAKEESTPELSDEEYNEVYYDKLREEEKPKKVYNPNLPSLADEDEEPSIEDEEDIEF